VEPGLPPELALGGDRSPIRAVWTTQEPDTRASRKRSDAASWGRSPGSDASVHSGAEAVPWNQAPGCQSGRSYFEHLRNLQRPVTSSPRRSGRRPCVELASHRGGGLARRCHSVVAEATCEQLPIAACRGRLTFGGVDLSGLRRGRAPRLPACPGSRGKRAGRRATEEPVSR
jgi:hypothetical protein